MCMCNHWRSNFMDRNAGLSGGDCCLRLCCSFSRFARRRSQENLCRHDFVLRSLYRHANCSTSDSHSCKTFSCQLSTDILWTFHLGAEHFSNIAILKRRVFSLHGLVTFAGIAATFLGRPDFRCRFVLLVSNVSGLTFSSRN